MHILIEKKIMFFFGFQISVLEPRLEFSDKIIWRWLFIKFAFICVIWLRFSIFIYEN